MKPPLILLAILLTHGVAFCQSTTFTYQGRLAENGAPANGTYEIRCALFDAANGGN